MGNLVNTEWYKLVRDRSLWVLGALLLVFAVADPLIRWYENSPNLPAVREYYLYVLELNQFVMKFVVPILAGFFITSEYSRGTMKIIASSGHSRVRIYIAKLALFSVGAVLIALIQPMMQTGVSAIFFGFHDLPDGSFYLQTIGLTVLYMASLASIMAAVSVMFTDSGKTIGFLLLFFMMIEPVLELLGSKIPFLRPFTDHSVFLLLREISNVGEMSGSELQTLVMVPVLTFLAFATLGSLVFRKKEIK